MTYLNNHREITVSLLSVEPIKSGPKPEQKGRHISQESLIADSVHKKNPNVRAISSILKLID